jgi:hypothetical protein
MTIINIIELYSIEHSTGSAYTLSSKGQNLGYETILDVNDYPPLFVLFLSNFCLNYFNKV